MTRRLSGQSAIVTGASSGIGLAVARALAENGASLAVNYHSDEASAEALVGEIRDAGGQAIAVQADISREDEVRRLFATAVEAFGTVDILVANAGIQKDAAFPDLTVEAWRRVLDVNLTGQFLCAREAVREFLRRGPRPQVSRALGKIICMSSVHEVIPWAGHANYAASKGGVMLMMKSLAQEVAHHRIRVNSIAPGAIRTDINRAAWEKPEAEDALVEKIPYGRIGEPQDIGKVAAWLACDEADYITGTTIFVDGGMALYPAFREGG